MDDLGDLEARCRAFAPDPAGWRLELCEAAPPLFGARIGLSTEIEAVWTLDAKILLHVDAGWDSAGQKAAFLRFQTEGGNAQDPMRPEIDRRRGEILVAATSHCFDFAAYRETPFFQRYMVPARCGDILAIITAIGDPARDRWSLTSLIRGIDDPLYGPEEIRRAQILARWLRTDVGAGLADTSSPVARLTPRQRDVLGAMLEGLSEPDGAARLGLKASTFHSHVGDIFRLFDVRGRAELQARFYGVGRLRDLGSDIADPRHGRLRRRAEPMAESWPARDTILRPRTSG